MVRRVETRLKNRGEYLKILFLPDHPTPYTLKTHTSAPVPYLMYHAAQPQKGVQTLTEESAKQTGNFVEYGFLLLQKMLAGKAC
ncbi:MAG: hypothetical protein K2L51_06210 [Clostridiales bacterium]|nr:hypothetical protein [Clostridiales bacterium]